MTTEQQPRYYVTPSHVGYQVRDRETGRCVDDEDGWAVYAPGQRREAIQRCATLNAREGS